MAGTSKSGSSSHHGRLTLPREVKQAEQGYIDRRRAAVEAEVSKSPGERHEAEAAVGPPPVVGLALSGGGIRSATFCLGAIQSLARRNVLKIVDYMCTVSGGGYIGSCLSSLTTAPGRKDIRAGRDRISLPRTLYAWEEPRAKGTSKFSFDTVSDENMPLLQCDQVHHLRKHGDLLVLRRGLFRREVIRTLGALVVAWSAALTFFFSVLLAVVGLYFGYAWWFSGEKTWAVLGRLNGMGSWPGWTEAFCRLWPTWEPCLWMLAIGAGLSFVCWIFAYDRVFRTGAPCRRGEIAEDAAERLRLWGFAIVLAAVMLAAGWYVAGRLLPDGSELGGLSLPIAFALGALAVQGVLYVWPYAWGLPRWNRPKRSVFHSMQGVCFYFLLGALAVAVLTVLAWWLARWFESDGMSKGAGGAAALLVNLVFIRVFAQPAGDGAAKKGFRAAVAAKTGPIVLAVAVIVLLVAAPLICAVCMVQFKAAVACWILVGSGVAAPVLGFLVDFNRISPHYFYRDRLVETYLRTEAPNNGSLEIVRSDEHLRVKDLHRRDGSDNTAPYHLILSSLNLAGSRDLARKDRKSDHFIFSQAYCGSTTTGYVPTGDYRGGRTKLCAAMTISGAAVSSASGFQTSFFTAFAMTLFNLRLGFWVLNPGRCKHREFPDYDPRPKTRGEPSLWERLCKLVFRKVGVFWPQYLRQEMFSATTADGRMVNLSDGGHTGDNLGIYPLLQRRCDVIVVCDAECDTGYTSSSLAAAVRQIYVDENVEVEIELDAVQDRDDEGLSSRHFAVGKIHYPDCSGSNPNHPDKGAKQGVLVYLKSSLTGSDDPVAVRSYARQHADFPQQPTADLFFDDAQFEAYRALGSHVADKAVGEAKLDVPIGGRKGLTLQDLAERYYV